MKFLIPTEPDDTHAILVKLALEKIGHKVSLIFTADQPTRLKNTVSIDNQSYTWQSNNEFNDLSNQDYEVVWWRRARRPFVPRELIHPDDYDFVQRENSLFYESFTTNLAPNAWWINTKESARKANFKLLQLKIASDCGMNIPTTLCSNNPSEIRNFIAKHDANGVIYKPLSYNFWFEENDVKISYTNRVRLKDLPEDDALQISPGIFQKEIKKQYELRVTCFGDYIVPAKIDSQEHDDGILDWRAIRKKPIQVEKYKLPANIELKIRAFMRKIGIVFGSFDFIVTPEDEYIFLEVNEQGQFLWIEDLNPNFKMLDIFINFMLNKSPHFEWNKKNTRHSIKKYEPQIQEIYEENIKRHIHLNRPKIEY
ncbi:MAG: hypothetical protein A3E88_05855 [Legionellales bacterium RIFCSPHIGHO2_12_FULL_35_11]|nr:MAG: hypothetical protein A3E88_05855 [Legionellales bacterium RIFCSPHIGHO2_12_FULL_35_11]